MRGMLRMLSAFCCWSLHWSTIPISSGLPVHTASFSTARRKDIEVKHLVHPLPSFKHLPKLPQCCHKLYRLFSSTTIPYPVLFPRSTCKKDALDNLWQSYLQHALVVSTWKVVCKVVASFVVVRHLVQQQALT